MAHTKAQRAVRGNRDSIAKRRGVKKYGGMFVQNGNILVRQKGTKFFPGVNTIMGSDFTIAAAVDGIVVFYEKNDRKFVGVQPADTEQVKKNRQAAKKPAPSLSAGA